MQSFLAIMLITAGAVAAGAQPTLDAQLQANAADARRAIAFCRDYAHGWLAHADPVSGLLPRRLAGENDWNARDCAADNFPFLLLTARISGDPYLNRAAAHIFAQEQALTLRVRSLPDTFDFATQDFLEAELDRGELLFGASEYAKDGLMPAVEWLGPGPYHDRMEGLVRDIWAEAGGVPTDNVEVHGEMLQTGARLYWQTGDTTFRDWPFALAERYLVEDDMTQWEEIRLRDHGCEIIGGLSEAYYLSAQVAPERQAAWRAPLHALLYLILEKGVYDDGMMPSAFRPATGQQHPRLNDNWGYVYNAFLTVDLVDAVPRYRDAVRHALENLGAYVPAKWEGQGGADGYADSIEGGLNLLNRIPVEAGFAWVDASMEILFGMQRDDGIIEAWYGDGNSARTVLMYALWKTQGVRAAPWRKDVRLGAVRENDHTLHLTLGADFYWTGTLHFDRPRHRVDSNLPDDYPRINQFPEWFTIDAAAQYALTIGGKTRTMAGAELLALPLTLEPGQTVRLEVREAAARQGASSS